jgi:putative ABC transport system permease protein
VRRRLALAVPGAAVAFACAALASRALATLLFDVSRLDPITCLAILGVLGCVAMCACALPAWRAARVDPSIALRAE